MPSTPTSPCPLSLLSIFGGWRPPLSFCCPLLAWAPGKGSCQRSQILKARRVHLALLRGLLRGPGLRGQHLLMSRTWRSLPQRSADSFTKEGRGGSPTDAGVSPPSHLRKLRLLEDKLFPTLVADGEANFIPDCRDGCRDVTVEYCSRERWGSTLNTRWASGHL